MSETPSEHESEASRTADALCLRFAHQLSKGLGPCIEIYLQEIPIEAHSTVFSRLLTHEIEHLARQNDPIDAAAYMERFKDYSSTVKRILDLRDQHAYEHETEFYRDGTDPETVPQRPELPGTRLGPYQLIRKIGQGGMGQVYLAEHLMMERQVAIKILPKSLTSKHSAVMRFLREVRLMAKLDHPNIVRAFDGNESDGIYYLVMEYVDGVDLGQHVIDHGAFAFPEAISLVAQVALGMSYAHEAGIIHRDIKPSNLVRDSTGRVKILDLGLASLSKGIDDGESLTDVGEMMGTIDYMAPEQADDAKSAGVAADIYSLGCTLYFLIAGSPPFGKLNSLAAIIAHHEQTPPSLSACSKDVPHKMDVILGKMMAKSPQERFSSMKELLGELGDHMAETGNLHFSFQPAQHETVNDPIALRQDFEEDAPAFIPKSVADLDQRASHRSRSTPKLLRIAVSVVLLTVIVIGVAQLISSLSPGPNTATNLNPNSVTPVEPSPTTASEPASSIRNLGIEASELLLHHGAIMWVVDGDDKVEVKSKDELPRRFKCERVTVIEPKLPTETLKRISSIPTVKSGLALTLPTDSDDSHLRALRDVRLRSLAVFGSQISDAGFMEFAREHRSISHVDVRDTALTSNSEPALALFRGLESLYVSGSELGNSLEPLTKMPRFRHAYLDTSQVTPEAAQILNSFNHSVALIVDSPVARDWSCLTLVASTSNITNLALTSEFHDEGGRHLRNAVHLTDLSIINSEFSDAGLRHLRELSNLSRLTLVRTNVTQDGCDELNGHLSECEITLQE